MNRVENLLLDYGYDGVQYGGMLHTVYKDGVLMKDEFFEDIRNRLNEV